jgi:hypothetical protein
MAARPASSSPATGTTATYAEFVDSGGDQLWHAFGSPEPIR